MATNIIINRSHTGVRGIPAIDSETDEHRTPSMNDANRFVASWINIIISVLYPHADPWLPAPPAPEDDDPAWLARWFAELSTLVESLSTAEETMNVDLEHNLWRFWLRAGGECTMSYEWKIRAVADIPEAVVGPPPAKRRRVVAAYIEEARHDDEPATIVEIELPIRRGS